MSEDRIVILKNGVEAVEANYKEQVIREYRENPLIEALPPIYSIEEVVDKLAFYPHISNDEIDLKPHYRFHVIQRIFQYFQPLYIHIDLENRISRLIRQGYVARNPFRKEYVESFKEGYKMMTSMNKELDCNKTYQTTASGFTVVGVSGMGKSTAINRVLSLYPQIIVHSKYKELDFCMYQVSWIKLDCPPDGSLKALCLDFFLKVDNMLGTSYYKKYGISRQSMNVLLPIMGQVARNIALGVLIIDEIQHLSLAKSGGSDRMLNYFVTLVNTIGVPVILVGTNKAINILQSEFRQARRGSGQGDIIWERMEKDDNWNLLIEGLWEYQWLKKWTPITEELKNVLYEESCGITDIAIKLFAMAQIRAIASGKEEITDKGIKTVASENLKLVKPMLEALKSGNIRKISQYEDIYPIDVDGFVNNEISKYETQEKIQALQKKMRNKTTETNNSIKEQAILKLLDLDVKGFKAKKAVESVIQNSNKHLEINEVVKMAYKLLLEEGQQKSVKRKNDMDLTDAEDLRVLVLTGRKKNETAYEIFKNNGFIRKIENDFPVYEAR